MKKLPRNMRCPCGSGMKVKHCCFSPEVANTNRARLKKLGKERDEVYRKLRVEQARKAESGEA